MTMEPSAEAESMTWVDLSLAPPVLCPLALRRRRRRGKTAEQLYLLPLRLLTASAAAVVFSMPMDQAIMARYLDFRDPLTVLTRSPRLLRVSPIRRSTRTRLRTPTARPRVGPLRATSHTTFGALRMGRRMAIQRRGKWKKRRAVTRSQLARPLQRRAILVQPLALAWSPMHWPPPLLVLVVQLAPRQQGAVNGVDRRVQSLLLRLSDVTPATTTALPAAAGAVERSPPLAHAHRLSVVTAAEILHATRPLPRAVVLLQLVPPPVD